MARLGVNIKIYYLCLTHDLAVCCCLLLSLSRLFSQIMQKEKQFMWLVRVFPGTAVPEYKRPSHASLLHTIRYCRRLTKSLQWRKTTTNLPMFQWQPNYLSPVASNRPCLQTCERGRSGMSVSNSPILPVPHLNTLTFPTIFDRSLSLPSRGPQNTNSSPRIRRPENGNPVGSF
jgi:hypothetical protein